MFKHLNKFEDNADYEEGKFGVELPGVSLVGSSVVYDKTTHHGNYLLLSGSINEGGTGTIAEIGADYSTADLSNNPPKLYRNGYLLPTDGYSIIGGNLTCYFIDGPKITITTAESPATYSVGYM